MPVTRADWKTSPLPEQRTRLEISRALLETQMERLRQGLKPESMDDRWFVFYEQYRLYLHRSWTGYCVYIAYFRSEKGLWFLTHADANRDPAQYTQTDDATDARALAGLISGLLGEPFAYVDPALPAELQPLFQWTFLGKQFLDGHE